ncbi:hypothetical protein KFL_003360080 [Klebsormidium nitens]|uniref:Uncharacterized protein n=1 Tax=Klebsormidium nitens TaxID=105231 RepID=A0A1Y1IEM0_KLENI|nr:hypothetical protein KFL_003360080 [Klebsormidium nitens]|eukprot:GAQ87176.1 hypothetical protein KFL_003360080 [Klebsormidium nitens]
MEQPHQGRPSLEDDDECHETNFGFAINKKEFSDRLLDLIATSDEEAVREMLWFCYDEKLCQCIIKGPKGVDFLLKIKEHIFMMCPQRCTTEANPDGCAAILVNYSRISEDAPQLEMLLITLYAKAWPEGEWQKLGTLSHDVKDPSARRVCVGRCDVSKEAWSTFIKSTKWFDKDGQLHVRIRILPFFK